MRRGLSWVLAAPLLATGVVVGHTLGYRWAVSDPHARAHLLQDTGHGYFAYLPLLLGVGVTLVLASLVARFRAAARGEGGTGSPPWLVATLPPVAFLAQELVERLLHTGHVHVSALGEPAVLIGLALQLPLALIALGLARLLGDVADAIGAALAHHLPPRLSLVPAWVVVASSPVRCSVATRGWTERGPPSHSF
jgi:hypothetical protein